MSTYSEETDALGHFLYYRLKREVGVTTTDKQIEKLVADWSEEAKEEGGDLDTVRAEEYAIAYRDDLIEEQEAEADAEEEEDEEEE